MEKREQKGQRAETLLSEGGRGEGQEARGIGDEKKRKRQESVGRQRERCVYESRGGDEVTRARVV